MSVRTAVALVVALSVTGPMSAVSQEAAGDETALLAVAAEREEAGDLAGSERALLEALETRRSSVPALLALERVLRMQGRLSALPRRVERALEEDPRSALLNRLLVRSYSELNQVERLEAAAAAWIEAVPTLEIPYREIAEVWRARGEYGRAREVLEQGRSSIGEADALALELGDLYAAIGEASVAVQEWALAVGPDGRGLSQVRRRLQALPHGGAAVVDELVDRLLDGGGAGRGDAALELAVEGGLEDRARAVAEERLPELSSRERRGWLEHLALRSDAAGLAGLAYWAYDGLLAEPGADEMDQGRLAALRQRRAELAAMVGDTAAASSGLAAFEEGGGEGTGSSEAAAARIELVAAQDPEQARAALERFRERSPGSPELDRLTGIVAEGLLDQGRETEAAELLAGSGGGPRTELLRARLLLAGGNVRGARAAYMAAAAGLRGAEATAVLARVKLLGRISETGGALVGQALALQETGRAGEAVDRVRASLAELPGSDRPALLAFAAELAEEAGLPGDASALRQQLVADHPRAPEAPEALLALALDLSGREGHGGEARELLERLIIEYPRSALVPRARQALDRLKRAGVARDEGGDRWGAQ